MTPWRPWIAAACSFLIPGLGQLYNRDRGKGVALLCISAGIGGGILWARVGPAAFRSWLTPILLGAVYLMVWIPAALDAYQHAAGAPRPLLSGQRAWYVLLMLASVGPLALPLLWQSPRFSMKAKVIWSFLVIALTLTFILGTVIVVPRIEHWYRQQLEVFELFP